jgi:hypothetical protein
VLADKASLKLGNAAHDGQHQPAGIGRGVAPAFPEGGRPLIGPQAFAAPALIQARTGDVD